jgi:CMP-N-acetylneuraminic acid synthetase
MEWFNLDTEHLYQRSFDNKENLFDIKNDSDFEMRMDDFVMDKRDNYSSIYIEEENNFQEKKYSFNSTDPYFNINESKIHKSLRKNLSKGKIRLIKFF